MTVRAAAPLPAYLRREEDDERLLQIFLARLRRLLHQHAEHAEFLNADGVRLLQQAIFSTYCDCRVLGGQALAQGLVRTRRSA